MRPANRWIASSGSSEPIGPISRGSRTSPTCRPGEGWLYVAFVIDVYARRIVGWRVNQSMATDFVFEALEQATYKIEPLFHQSLVSSPMWRLTVGGCGVRTSLRCTGPDGVMNLAGGRLS